MLLLIFVMLIGLTGGFVLLGLPPVIDLLFDLYGVSYAGMSVLLSALLWSHAAVQVPGGIVIDRLGLRRSLVLCLIFMLAGSLLPALAPLYGIALIGRIVAGFGTGLSFIVCMKMVAVNFGPKKAGMIQGFYGGLFSGGSILAFYFLPSLVVYSWRLAFLGPAALVACCIVLVFFLKLKPEQPNGAPHLPVRKIAAMPQSWTIAALHAFSYGSVIMLGNWIPSVIAEMHHVTSAEGFAWVSMLVLFISGISRFGGGFLLIRFSALKLGLITVALVLIFYVGLFVVPQPGMVISLAVLICLFGSVNFGALWSLAARLSTAESMGVVFGFVNLLANLGAVLFTLMMGWTKDVAGSFTPGFLLMAVGSLLALFFGVRVLGRDSRMR